MLDALAERGRSESWKNRLVRRNFSVTEFHAYAIIRQMNIYIIFIITIIIIIIIFLNITAWIDQQSLSHTRELASIGVF